jgi:hypothetical protein
MGKQLGHQHAAWGAGSTFMLSVSSEAWSLPVFGKAAAPASGRSRIPRPPAARPHTWSRVFRERAPLLRGTLLGIRESRQNFPRTHTIGNQHLVGQALLPVQLLLHLSPMHSQVPLCESTFSPKRFSRRERRKNALRHGTLRRRSLR